jgi:hypothetical protein
MGFLFTYQRPAYVCPKRSARRSTSSGPRSDSPSFDSNSSLSSPCGIPAALAFEPIVSGGACPVCSWFRPVIQV